MGMLIAPYHNSPGGVVASQLYVNVRKSSAQSSMSNSLVTWETVSNGDAVLFNLATEGTVAPASYTLGRARCQINESTTGILQIQRDGSTTYNAKGTSVPGVNADVMNFFTGIQPLTPGVTTFSLLAASGAIDASDDRWFGFELYPSNHRYALAVKTSDSASIPVDTVHDVTFDTDLADADGMHSTSSNTHRFQVPSVSGNATYEVGSGNCYVRYRTQIRMASSGGSGEGWLFTRYATTSGGALGPVTGGFYHQTVGVNTDHYLHGATAILTVPGGAVFGSGILSGSGATAVVKGTQNTWGELELLPNTTKFVLLHGSASQTFGAGGDYRKTFATTITNNCGATINGDGSITTPSGFTECRVSFNVVTNSIACYAYALVGGNFLPGNPAAGSNGPFGDSQNGEGNWVPISSAGGQLIEVRVSAVTSFTMSSGPEVWMNVEFR